MLNVHFLYQRCNDGALAVMLAYEEWPEGSSSVYLGASVQAAFCASPVRARPHAECQDEQEVNEASERARDHC